MSNNYSVRIFFSLKRAQPVSSMNNHSVRTFAPTPKYVRKVYGYESNFPSSSKRITPATGRSTYVDDYSYTNSSRSITRSGDWSSPAKSTSKCSTCLK